MHFIDSFILGAVEGITEFLPISSTAHMILVSKILGLAQSDFLKSFEIVIQLGAILAVVVMFWKKIFYFQVLKKVIIGFIPTAVLGLLLYKRVKEYLGDVSVVLWALLVGGIIIVLFEKWHKSRAGGAGAALSPLRCIYIGLFQSLAFIPGVSRSGATIIGGMSLGVSREEITEYSFLLAVPTMVAATGLDVIKNKDMILHSGNLALLLVGLITAFIFAMLAIKGFMSYVRKNDFLGFGIYRIAIAVFGFLFLINIAQ